MQRARPARASVTEMWGGSGKPGNAATLEVCIVERLSVKDNDFSETDDHSRFTIQQSNSPSFMDLLKSVFF